MLGQTLGFTELLRDYKTHFSSLTVFSPAALELYLWLCNHLQISVQYPPDNEMHYGGLVNVTVEEMKVSVNLSEESAFPLSSPRLYSVQLVEVVP